MASVFGHAMVGFTLSKVIDTKQSRKLLVFAIVSTILPDIDVLAFSLDIPYSHPFGHRGFTHSILFAIIWASILTLLFGKLRKKIWWLVIFFSTISHGVFDAMTSGGKGVGFLIPFNNERYFFPFREIKVSPIGIEKFFSEWGMSVLFSEFKFILIPSILVLLVVFMFKKHKK